MRVFLTVICISFVLGLLYPQDWIYLYQRLRWQVWHEHFTNCCYVTERRHGEEFALRHPAVGLTPAQAIKLFGKPDIRWWMQLTPYGPVPGVKMDGTPNLDGINSGRVEDCWFYTKQHHIMLSFKKGICLGAGAAPNPCSHMLKD
jgi:hypothetical protein